MGRQESSHDGWTIPQAEHAGARQETGTVRQLDSAGLGGNKTILAEDKTEGIAEEAEEQAQLQLQWKFPAD